MLSIRYPTEISRSQRSLLQIENFKANEYRNMLFYAGVFALHKSVKKTYFTHFALLITSLRLLTIERPDNDDIRSANEMLHYFVMQFKTIYGVENMDYKLHAHLHLPLQVARHGPLNKTSCFPFEGKKCK